MHSAQALAQFARIALYKAVMAFLLVLQILNVDIPLKRRDPHYFLPTTGTFTLADSVKICALQVFGFRL